MKTFSSTSFWGGQCCLFVCFCLFFDFTMHPVVHSEGTYTKRQTPFLWLDSSPLLSAVTSLVHMFLAFLSGYLQNRFSAAGGYWIKRYVHTYLILPDIVRPPSLGFVLLCIPIAVYESVYFLTSLPTEHVVRPLGLRQSDKVSSGASVQMHYNLLAQF